MLTGTMKLKARARMRTEIFTLSSLIPHSAASQNYKPKKKKRTTNHPQITASPSQLCPLTLAPWPEPPCPAGLPGENNEVANKKGVCLF